MARPRKPTQLKLINGTLRPGRANPDEPKLPFAIPDPPPYLSADERDAWEMFSASLTNLRIGSAADFAALEVLACNWATAQRMREVVRREGDTYETTTPQGCSMVRPRPEVAIANKADAMVLAMLSRFGLTPSDRSRVSSAPHGRKGGGDDEFQS